MGGVGYGRKSFVPSQEPTSSLVAPKAAPPEKLMYTRESIFFGGPQLSVPVRDREGSRSERGSGSREG